MNYMTTSSSMIRIISYCGRNHLLWRRHGSDCFVITHPHEGWEAKIPIPLAEGADLDEEVVKAMVGEW